MHVCVFAFDLLYLNGESWVKKPLRCVQGFFVFPVCGRRWLCNDGGGAHDQNRRVWPTLSHTHAPPHTHMYIQCIYRERRQALYELLGPVVEPGHFDFATHVETGQVG